jgi:hypothetical protein
MRTDVNSYYARSIKRLDKHAVIPRRDRGISSLQCPTLDGLRSSASAEDDGGGVTEDNGGEVAGDLYPPSS